MSVFHRLLLLIFCISANQAHADRSVTLAVGEWPPYVSQELESNGPITKLVLDAFSSAGIRSELKWLPWARALRKTAKAELSATFPWYKSQKRAKQFLFSEPLMTESTAIFHNKSLNFDWNTLSDLSNYRIGANTDYFYSEAFSTAERNGSLNITRVDTELQLIQMLHRGRLDLILMGKTPGHVFIDQASAQDTITAHPKAFAEKQLYLLFPKADHRSAQRLAGFNRGLRHLKARTWQQPEKLYSLQRAKIAPEQSLLAAPKSPQFRQ